MRGTKPHLVVDNGAISKAERAPSFLSKEAKVEWRRIMPALVKRRILTVADLGSVENYCVVIGRIRQVERELQSGQGAPDAALVRMQNAAMQTARQLAAELGLTPVSRARPVIRDDNDDGDLSDLDLG